MTSLFYIGAHQVPPPDSELSKNVHENLPSSLLELLANDLYWFATTPNISKNALGKQLQMKKKIFPEGNSYPKCFKEAMKMITPFLSTIESHHVCVKDCIWYFGKYENCQKCPVCNEPRYTPSGNPRRVFYYMPLKDRLVRIFSDAKLSKLVQDHANIM